MTYLWANVSTSTMLSGSLSPLPSCAVCLKWLTKLHNFPTCNLPKHQGCSKRHEFITWAKCRIDMSWLCRFQSIQVWVYAIPSGDKATQNHSKLNCSHCWLGIITCNLLRRWGCEDAPPGLELWLNPNPQLSGLAGGGTTREMDC